MLPITGDKPVEPMINWPLSRFADSVNAEADELLSMIRLPPRTHPPPPDPPVIPVPPCFTDKIPDI